MTTKKAKQQAPLGEPIQKPTKKEVVSSLLARSDGASLAEIVEATGWLPHTARAMLTGLRKKFEVTKEKVEGATRYRISNQPK